MPAITAPSKVLVTGASGFLAAWVVKSLLERGHSVRGTVRSSPKGEYLRNLFDKDYPGKFEYVIVEDIAKPGAFDDAVIGVDAIAHTASPVIFLSPETPAEALIEPAVHGTTEVLKSAAKQPSVKRVVFTSSGAALLEPHDGPYAYSERDWNEYSVTIVKEQGTRTDGVHKYRASKTLAERALWDFIRDNKSSFDAVAVNPPFIYGPVIQEVASIDQLNLSSKQLYDALANELPEDKLAAYAGQYIDVREVAEVHVDGLEQERLGGRRLVIGRGPLAWQDIYDAANSIELPELPFKIPKGKPGIQKDTVPTFVRYSTESTELLGRNLRQLPEIIRDTLLSLKERKLI